MEFIRLWNTWPWQEDRLELEGFCNQWTGRDWTDLLCKLHYKAYNYIILIVYCVCCYFEEALQPHIANPQSAGRGEQGGVAGLSTLFANRTIVIPSAGVFTHLTDFVAKANTAVHSMYISQCRWS